jgi:nitroreductase
MDVYEAAVKRRSIRRFQDKPVPYDVLEKCVDAGRLAPCGRNHQVCEYIIVDDAKLLPEVFENIGGSAIQSPEKGGPLPENRAKAYIITLINKHREDEYDANRRRITLYDVGIAAENIILVALEQGIGTCPILMFNEGGLKQVLNIPDKYDLALVIAMGYPNESPVPEVSDGPVNIWVDDQGVRHVPKRKLEDITHRNKFS